MHILGALRCMPCCGGITGGCALTGAAMFLEYRIEGGVVTAGGGHHLMHILTSAAVNFLCPCDSHCQSTMHMHMHTTSTQSCFGMSPCERTCFFETIDSRSMSTQQEGRRGGGKENSVCFSVMKPNGVQLLATSPADLKSHCGT